MSNLNSISTQFWPKTLVEQIKVNQRDNAAKTCKIFLKLTDKYPISDNQKKNADILVHWALFLGNKFDLNKMEFKNDQIPMVAGLSQVLNNGEYQNGSLEEGELISISDGDNGIYVVFKNRFTKIAFLPASLSLQVAFETHEAICRTWNVRSEDLGCFKNMKQLSKRLKNS